MATIKAYSDLQQSRKLAEILPLESADMRYAPFGDTHPWVWDEEVKLLEKGSVPCWSLAVLLDILPFPVLYMEMVAGMILWCCECHFIETDEVIKIEHYDNPIDACYEMILRLKEQNLL